MAIVQRGKITSPDRARQLRDFSGLRFGTITPTDIDGLGMVQLSVPTIAGLIEYHNKGYVIIELKLKGASVPGGQRLALERLHNDLSKAGKETLCIIAEHNAFDPEQPIDVARAIVTEYRRTQGAQWHPDNKSTVKDAIASFLLFLCW